MEIIPGLGYVVFAMIASVIGISIYIRFEKEIKKLFIRNKKPSLTEDSR